MESEDLMLDNLVLNPHGVMCTIDTISRGSVRLSALDDSFKYESFNINEIFPVELTQSHLFQLGFKKIGTSKDFYLYIKGGKKIFIHTRIRGFTVNKHMNPLKYFHELQQYCHSRSIKNLFRTYYYNRGKYQTEKFGI